MDVQSFLTTERLLIKPLATTDTDFILELVNTEGWIRFIGNRNVNSPVEADAYIQRILANPNIKYWVVQRKDDQQSIGIVTYIKRDYLEHHDIGFAFLPNVSKQGYAFEATYGVLKKLTQEQNISHILATTVPENSNSIKLLERIGLTFQRELDIETKTVHVYGAATELLKF